MTPSESASHWTLYIVAALCPHRSNGGKYDTPAGTCVECVRMILLRSCEDAVRPYLMAAPFTSAELRAAAKAKTYSGIVRKPSDPRSSANSSKPKKGRPGTRGENHWMHHETPEQRAARVAKMIATKRKAREMREGLKLKPERAA